jgi:enoyl-CoA hydratase
MTATDTTTQEPPVLTDRAGSLGRIRLNRPQALNSLTLDMVRRISEALDRFEDDPDVAAVLITGEGERGLCAGGDIKAIYYGGRAGADLAAMFWREEYIVNARIKDFPKPYIAIMDGITMGGGVGVSAHGGHRIVTERTRLAMPETGIGFFPDVGGTWLLSHGPGEIGTYLGLAGEQIGASDAIYAGLADVFAPRANLPGLIHTLETLPTPPEGEQVRKIIDQFAQPTASTPLQESRAEIDQAFAFDKIELILAGLAKSGSEFTAKTRASLLSKSPTSLKLTLRLLRLGRLSANLEDCLEREFAAGRKIMIGHDFYEGVRAAVIDKDRNPRWSPDKLDQVSDADIEAYLGAAPEPLFPAGSSV